MCSTNVCGWFITCLLLYAQVASGQCYTECLRNRTEASVRVNVAVEDTRNTWAAPLYDWLASKVVEFNALYLSITVNLAPISLESVDEEILQDVMNGSNICHAYLMNMDPRVATMSEYLLDMSKYTVNNVNDIAWQRVGRFSRSHAALYHRKVLVLPLAGDFMTLMYRVDYFDTHGKTVPRTSEEYAQLAQYFDGKDLDGDGVPDYGSCCQRTGFGAQGIFETFVAAYTQYLGTSQGLLFHTETLEPLLDNPAVHEALKIWREVGGPTIESPVDAVALWSQGRCAMTYVLLRFPCEQYHTGITRWINTLWERSNTPVNNRAVTIHLKEGSVSARFVSETELNVKTLLPDTKMMVSPTRLRVPFVASKQLSLSANPNHSKTGRSESNLRLGGACWQNSSKFSSLKEMMKVPSLSLHLMPVRRFLA